VDELTFARIKRFIKKHLPFKPFIAFVSVWAGTRCTLTCRRCCNLVPFLPQRSYDMDEVIEDLRFLARHANIGYVQIQGGEPFTHHQLDKLIYAVSSLNIDKKEIATNGSVTPSDAVLQALSDCPDITVRVSKYECATSQRIDLIKKLSDHNIKLYVYDFIYNLGSWFFSGGIHEIRNDNVKTENIFLKCCNRLHISLIDGILVTCGKIPTIKHLYGEETSHPYDELDIRKMRNTIKSKHKIYRYLRFFKSRRRAFKEQCRYCVATNDRFPPAEQMEKAELENELSWPKR
jgi:uncharacterized Fe-S cluster-containing radical SAM superfamily protein